jgi:hypothetical protein
MSQLRRSTILNYTSKSQNTDIFHRRLITYHFHPHKFRCSRNGRHSHGGKSRGQILLPVAVDNIDLDLPVAPNHAVVVDLVEDNNVPVFNIMGRCSSEETIAAAIVSFITPPGSTR